MSSIKCDDVITRKGMLSTVSSTFDPLGLVSPVLIIGKILFQDATRLKLIWDDEVPCELASRWNSWVKSVCDLENVKIPRCIKPKEFDDAYIELHNFSDASERAYGCCSYLRCVNKFGRIHTALIMSKSKVSPIKQVSIPRLELQGAVLSATIGALMIRELDIVISDSYFWVDSQIVLQSFYLYCNRKHVKHMLLQAIESYHCLTNMHQFGLCKFTYIFPNHSRSV